MGGENHLAARNETSKFNRDFLLSFFFPLSLWGWFSLTRNIREKHSFFQLSLSVGFPIRNYAQAAALHFVIMTGKNEFLMCYLYQLQRACGYSVTRHPESNEPALGWRATTENIIFRLKKTTFFHFEIMMEIFLRTKANLQTHTGWGKHINVPYWAPDHPKLQS